MMRVIENALHAEERALVELDRARSRLQCFAVEERIAIVGRVPGRRPMRDQRVAIVRFTMAGRAYFAAVERANRYIAAAKRRPTGIARGALSRPISGLCMPGGRAR